MHYFINQVWFFKKSSIHYRIIHIYPQLGVLSWIKVTEAAEDLPETIDIDDFKELIQKFELVLIPEDIIRLPPLEGLKPSTIEKWERNWNLIKDYVADYSLLYNDKQLNHLINSQISKTNGLSGKTIRRIFIRYWQRGMTKLAVLPDYQYSGGKGIIKKSSELKRGRPPAYTKGKLNIDERLRKLIVAGYNEYYLKRPGTSLKKAHEEFIAFKFFKKGKKTDPTSIPTYTQFRYWGEQEFSKDERLIRKVGLTSSNKDYRVITDSSRKDVIGPGSVFQIDSTPSDMELVSEINGDLLTGSPTLYLVSDVFSGTLVGFYTSYDPPSYFVAMLALANAVEDKKEFCAKYGVEIETKDWPSHHLPNAIVADRGELLGNQAENLVSEFGIAVANTTAYRPDMKGLVERHFQTVHSNLKAQRNGRNGIGFKGQRHGERGVRNARLDACLTLKEYIRILILEIIKYNSTNLLKEYPLDIDMVREKLSPIPNLLWQWGISNRAGALRVMPSKEFLFRLLPKQPAGLTRKGIKFLGNFYNPAKGPQELIDELNVLRRSNRSKNIDVEISYHPWDTTYLYVRYKGCTITFSVSESRSPIGKDVDKWTMDQYNITRKVSENQHDEESLDKRCEIIQDINEAVAEAKQKPKAKRSPSNAKKVRENKNAERNLNRDKTISEGRAKEEKSSKEDLTAKSHTLPSETAKDYKFPTFLNDLEDLIN